MFNIVHRMSASFTAYIEFQIYIAYIEYQVDGCTTYIKCQLIVQHAENVQAEVTFSPFRHFYL